MYYLSEAFLFVDFSLPASSLSSSVGTSWATVFLVSYGSINKKIFIVFAIRILTFLIKFDSWFHAENRKI